MDATLKRLLDLADSRGLTQETLARLAGLPPSRFTKLKGSKRGVAPRFDEVAALGRVLGDEFAFVVVFLAGCVLAALTWVCRAADELAAGERGDDEDARPPREG